MKETIAGLKGGESLLLHSCCAPCSSAVIEKLCKTFKITVFYYNPNIFPKEEYEKRKAEQIKLIEIINQTEKNKIEFLDSDYNNFAFKKVISDFEEFEEGSLRCLNCYKFRLEKTAEVAIKNNFNFFTTTLSVSPHKNSQFINEILIEIRKNLKESGIKTAPLLADFKKENGYLRSLELAKKHSLYRQNYCGCRPNKSFF